ncbi:MAG TPA: hypothetical protein ENN12_04540 [Epsilonproteobacteria bacterium]|nr:hypothetical protein [Campylobacterota bacterium]
MPWLIKVYHRIKNNLQLSISLLWLQNQKVENFPLVDIQK